MSSEISSGYVKLYHKFLATSLREQAFIVVCGCALVIASIYLVLMEPISLHNQKLQRDIASSQKGLTALSKQVEEILQNLASDPNDALRERLQVLKTEISSIDTMLEDQTVNLVPANKMPQMLEKVLASSKGLKVIELQSLPSMPILQDVQIDIAADTNLFRHGVILTLEGKYFDIQAYLEKMESLEWQFYWKKFDYSVSKYPVARVEVELYTLSTNKAFIGV
ncbi:MAG: MSHA biogenesis protein MshJ [Paraglaciecola sp.]|jgi:MSHA biogenesis protein MshJ